MRSSAAPRRQPPRHHVIGSAARHVQHSSTNPFHQSNKFANLGPQFDVPQSKSREAVIQRPEGQIYTRSPIKRQYRNFQRQRSPYQRARMT